MKFLLLFLLAGCASVPTPTVTDAELDAESARVVRMRQEMRGEVPRRFTQ